MDLSILDVHLHLDPAQADKHAMEAFRYFDRDGSGYITVDELQQACAEARAYIKGGGLGLAMGLFLGALDNPLMQQEMTGRQLFMYTARHMGGRSWSSCKAFAVMGFFFSAAECVIEKVEGDFDSFKGRWILEQLGNHHTLLKYTVESKMHPNSLLSEAIMEESTIDTP